MIRVKWTIRQHIKEKKKKLICNIKFTFMEGPRTSITMQKIATICTNDAQVIIILGRILITFGENYSQLMERNSIRCVNICIAARRKKKRKENEIHHKVSQCLPKGNSLTKPKIYIQYLRFFASSPTCMSFEL